MLTGTNYTHWHLPMATKLAQIHIPAASVSSILISGLIALMYIFYTL